MQKPRKQNFFKVTSKSSTTVYEICSNPAMCYIARVFPLLDCVNSKLYYKTYALEGRKILPANLDQFM